MVNVEIMRTFVRLRGIPATNVDLVKVVFNAIRQLMSPLPASKRCIGFAPWEEEG